MKLDPPQWYPWFWRDWQADFAVTRLSLAERGLYRELLDASWKAGGLPPNEADLAELARCRLAEFRRTWRAVKRFWRAGDDHLLRNDRLETIRARQIDKRASLAERGRRGGSAPRRSPAKLLLSTAKRAEQSRAETALLPTGAGRAAWKRRPSAPTTINAVMQDCTGSTALQGDPPTPEQAAELAAVRRALADG